MYHSPASPEDDDSAPPPPETPPGGDALVIRRRDEGEVITLVLDGKLELGALLTLRDAAFTAIGARPQVLCIDARRVSPLEIGAVNTLVTISRVARLVRVGFSLIASATATAMLEETGLIAILPPPERLRRD